MLPFFRSPGAKSIGCSRFASRRLERDYLTCARSETPTGYPYPISSLAGDSESEPPLFPSGRLLVRLERLGYPTPISSLQSKESAHQMVRYLAPSLDRKSTRHFYLGIHHSIPLAFTSVCIIINHYLPMRLQDFPPAATCMKSPPTFCSKWSARSPEPLFKGGHWSVSRHRHTAAMRNE